MWKLKERFYFEEDFEKDGARNFSSTSACGDAKNEKNRSRLLKSYFGSDAAVCGEQVHGNNIRIITEADSGKVFPETDGFITGDKRIILTIFTADCLPIFIFDTKKKVIGLVHAGREGLRKLIIERALDLFADRFGSGSSDLRIAIGPHICEECYGLDLDKSAEEQIRKAGIAGTRISNSDLCTYTGDFFSYRKTRTPERILSAIMMPDNIREGR